MSNLTTTLVIIEKQSQKEILEKSNIFIDYLTDKEYDFLETLSFVPFTFKYPKNIKYKEYPKSNNLEYKLNSSLVNFNQKILNQYEKLNKDYLLSFDELFLAPDFDHTGIYSVYLILENILGPDWKSLFKKIHYLKFISFDKKTINNEILQVIFDDNYNSSIEKKFDRLYEYAKIKRYFEYNYNINSNIFFKEVFVKLINSYINKEDDFFKNRISSLIEGEIPTFTKYIIMTFHIIAEDFNYNVKLNDLLSYIQKYEGSGKYSEYTNCSIGSPASVGLIIKRLEELALIDISDKGLVRFTDLGIQFHSLLHNKTFDVDLPFRIKNWCSSNFNEAIIGIDKYIYRYFSYQKAKNKFLIK